MTGEMRYARKGVFVREHQRQQPAPLSECGFWSRLPLAPIPERVLLGRLQRGFIAVYERNPPIDDGRGAVLVANARLGVVLGPGRFTTKAYCGNRSQGSSAVRSARRRGWRWSRDNVGAGRRKVEGRPCAKIALRQISARNTVVGNSCQHPHPEWRDEPP